MTARSKRSPIGFEVSVTRLPKKGMPVRIEASEAQRAELAAVHGLESVDRLVAEVTVVPWKRNGVKVDGRVEADIVQTCVVTLEPISNRIDADVAAIFVPEDSRLGREGFGEGGEIMLDVDGPDSPETFSGDRIDVGALAEEFFALEIDPYPRKPGAALPAEEKASEGEGEEEGPMQRKLRQLFPKS